MDRIKRWFKKTVETNKMTQIVPVHWVYLEVKNTVAKKYLHTWVQGQLRKHPKIAPLMSGLECVHMNVVRGGLWCALVEKASAQRGVIVERKMGVPTEGKSQIEVVLCEGRVWVYVCAGMHQWGHWFSVDQACAYIDALLELQPECTLECYRMPVQQKDCTSIASSDAWKRLLDKSGTKVSEQWQGKVHPFGSSSRGSLDTGVGAALIWGLCAINMVGVSIWAQSIWSKQQYTRALLVQEQQWISDQASELGFVMDLQKQLSALPNSMQYEKKQRIDQLRQLLEDIQVPLKQAGWNAQGVYAIPDWSALSDSARQGIQNALAQGGLVIQKEQDSQVLYWSEKQGKKE